MMTIVIIFLNDSEVDSNGGGVQLVISTVFSSSPEEPRDIGVAGSSEYIAIGIEVLGQTQYSQCALYLLLETLVRL